MGQATKSRDYIISLYTFTFTNGNKCYIYNSRSNFFSEVTSKLYDAISQNDLSQLPDNVLEELIKREIIVHKDAKYDYYYGKYIKFNTRGYNKSMMNLVLAPTTSCNFDCPYCFEPKKNPKTITTEVIDNLVKFIKSNDECKYIVLMWYGGEPLIAFDKIKAIYDALSAEDMPKIVSQSIVTNGYCVNDEVIDFFKTNGCESIQITIDGLGAKHDKSRRLLNSNKPTFDTIVANIDRLLAELPETRVSVRVNINKDNYMNFVEVHKFFKQRHPDNTMLNIYPGIMREENDDNTSLCTSSFAPTEIMDLHELIRKEGIDTSDFPQKTIKGCTMTSLNSYIIGPEGEMYKCWNSVSDPDSIIGYIDRDEMVNTSLFIKSMTQAIPFNDECKECSVFPICEGGCAYLRYRNMFEGCNFELCSPYKNPDKLKTALLTKTLKLCVKS